MTTSQKREIRILAEAGTRYFSAMSELCKYTLEATHDFSGPDYIIGMLKVALSPVMAPSEFGLLMKEVDGKCVGSELGELAKSESLTQFTI